MFCFILCALVAILFSCLSKRVTCATGVSLFPGYLPIIGHGLLLVRTKDIFSLLKDFGTQSIKNGGIVAFQLGWKSLYILTNPEEATTVLTKCLEKMFIYKLIDPLFGDTLVSAEGGVWKCNRRILDVAFRQSVLEDYLKVFNNQASYMVKMLSKKVGEGYVDVTNEVTRNVLETTCQTTMGLKVDGANFISDKYIEAIHRVFEIVTLRVQKQWLLLDAIFNRSTLKEELDKSLEIIHEFSTKMVQIRKLKYSESLQENFNIENHEEMRSFLQILIEKNSSQESPEGVVFTDHQLRCLCDNVLLAGFDTSTYQLLFTLVCIGSDADVQERIYAEITEVLGEDTMLTREHMARLVLLEAAIKEAIRLYPIGPVIAREATTDIRLAKVVIPAGSSIAVHLWAINRHKGLWGADAEEFHPGRWLSPATLPEHPNAFASFSFGRRNCIGKQYALMYMKTTLAQIIRNYRITGNHKHMDFDCYIMLKVKSGHLIKLELR